MGLTARIWAVKLGGGTKEEKEKEEEKEGKFALCESIGHRPLWGRCLKSKVIFQFQKRLGRLLEKIWW